jgi:tetratricopeptide (TPR) repeat protein
MAAALSFEHAISAYFQTGAVHWGEGQLRACARVLIDAPDFAAARFAAAMVFTARQAFGQALAAASAGADAQSRQFTPAGTPFPSIGLHWLRGLLLLRERQVGLAIESFAREMDQLPEAEVHAAELRVNAQVAAGFAHLAARDATGAIDAFRVALETVPRSGRALVGLYTAFQQTTLAREARALLPQIDQAIAELSSDGRLDEAALIGAASDGARGDFDSGCAILERLLSTSPPGHAGWQIPIDPALTPLRGHARFPRILAQLAERAE